MRHLFFSLEGEFEAVATRVFQALGLQTPRWGNSANAFGGTYADYAIDGVVIRLERNSYDYEDEFDYMIAIKRDPLAEGQVSDEVVRSVAEMVAEKLTSNLGIRVGVETPSGIQIRTP